MTKVTKFLLVLALVCLVAGLVVNSGFFDVGDFPALYILFPAGAIFLGMSLISRVLQSESAQYEREHHGAQTTGDRMEPLAAASQEKHVPTEGSGAPRMESRL